MIFDRINSCRFLTFPFQSLVQYFTNYEGQMKGKSNPNVPKVRVKLSVFVHLNSPRFIFQPTNNMARACVRVCVCVFLDSRPDAEGCYG